MTISPNLTRSVLGLSVGTGDAVVMSNNSTLIIGGTTLDINGTLRIDAGANGTDLRIDGAAALDGTGSLLLGGTSNNSRIIGAGTLTNTATIAGRGNIGANQLSLVNAVGGLVDANVNAAANSGAVLFLDPRNGDGFSNQGVMQASNGGLLQLYGGFGGAFNNAGGIIRAVGANSEVQLLSGASVTGGTLQTSGGGLIRGNASQTYHFADLTIDVGTQVRADNNSNLGVLRDDHQHRHHHRRCGCQRDRHRIAGQHHLRWQRRGCLDHDGSWLQQRANRRGRYPDERRRAHDPRPG